MNVCTATLRTLRVVVPAAALLLIAACHPGGNKPAAAAPPSPYATIANGKVDIEGGVVEVAARRPGVISEVLVQEGDFVHKGQILARQEDQDARLAVKSAKAAVVQAESQMPLMQVNLRTAQRELERFKTLVTSKLVSQQQVDQAGDSVASAQAQLGIQQSAVQTAEAQLAQADYNEDLTIIRAPMDGKIIRRYANPGAGASTLQVSDMFDLAPATRHIVRAEIVESAIPDVYVDQEVEIVPETETDKLSVGKVMRIAPAFGARKLKSDTANEAADERVVEVVVSADDTPYLIGQRVLVKFMKKGQRAGVKRPNQ